MTSDIERARAARLAKLEGEQSLEATRIARALVEQLGPEVNAGVESIALMIATIAVCDAFGIPRATMVESFTDLAKRLSYPAAVIE